MKRVIVVLFTLTVMLLATVASAQPTDPANWSPCILGGAPIADGDPPTDAEVFENEEEGPVVMSEAGPNGSVKFIRCRLQVGAKLYWGTDGVLRDLPSNQPLFTVGEYSIPRTLPVGPQGPTGPTGPQGPTGPTGPRGPAGTPCWDHNQNGIADPKDDMNGDDRVDSRDCTPKFSLSSLVPGFCKRTRTGKVVCTGAALVGGYFGGKKLFGGRNTTNETVITCPPGQTCGR